VRSPTPVVFAGISISHAKVRDLASADVRPPVRVGDLDLLRGNGTIVAIIDGELAPNAILSANEIERAIGRRLDLRGSSSVGALQAAEFRHRGMTGSGWVHRAFCTGWLTGTEEIAVLYDPRSFHALTVPLVTVRFWLKRFVRTGVITALRANVLMSAVKALRLQERTPQAVLMRLADSSIPEQMRKEINRITDPHYDIKARDALHLLRSLK
jgi:TfuA protein